ncbi:hypothetical protein DFH09DRAFT_1311730 [Mycena vulgaris]|nr:hypothetical protein DFH09DRAFT_1311730 [Mycena vulgaris]
MFILPAHAQVLPAAPARLRLFPAASLALTLLAAVLVLAVVRAAAAARRHLALPLSAKAIQVQVQQKSRPETSAKPASSWLPLRLSWKTLPPPLAAFASSHVPRRPHPPPRVEAPCTSLPLLLHGITDRDFVEQYQRYTSHGRPYRWRR